MSHRPSLHDGQKQAGAQGGDHPAAQGALTCSAKGLWALLHATSRMVLATTYTLWQSLPLKGKERKTLTMKEIKPSEIKDDDLKAQSFFFFSNSIPMLTFKPSDSIPFC